MADSQPLRLRKPKVFDSSIDNKNNSALTVTWQGNILNNGFNITEYQIELQLKHLNHKDNNNSSRRYLRYQKRIGLRHCECNDCNQHIIFRRRFTINKILIENLSHLNLFESQIHELWFME